MVKELKPLNIEINRPFLRGQLTDRSSQIAHPIAGQFFGHELICYFSIHCPFLAFIIIRFEISLWLAIALARQAGCDLHSLNTTYSLSASRTEYTKSFLDRQFNL